jgi:hypothetical protein
MVALEAFERCKRGNALVEATLVYGSEVNSFATSGQARGERRDRNQRVTVTSPFS